MIVPEVKWIKLAIDIFDNRKIRQIETMPEGDAIIVIWVKLLCLAGNVNENGFLYMTKEIPYTEQMLATQFNRPLLTVQLALKTFIQFGMIEVIDDVLHVSSWEKYQNIDGLERIREQGKVRQARFREKQKLLSSNVTSNVTGNADVTHSNAIEEDKEEDIEEELEREEEKKEIRERIDYQLIVDMYNETCVSFPLIRSISDSRRKAIKARLKTYSLEDFQLLFQKAESSSFLKGGNDRNWSATFDWLIKDSNMAKVLDGNYDDKSGSGFTKPKNKVAEQLEQSYQMMKDWGNS